MMTQSKISSMPNFKKFIKHTLLGQVPWKSYLKRKGKEKQGRPGNGAKQECGLIWSPAAQITKAVKHEWHHRVIPFWRPGGCVIGCSLGVGVGQAAHMAWCLTSGPRRLSLLRGIFQSRGSSCEPAAAHVHKRGLCRAPAGTTTHIHLFQGLQNSFILR